MRSVIASALLATALVLARAPTAAADVGERFAETLYTQGTAAAASLAEAEVAAAPDDATAQFALGAARFLAAVEGLAQGLYRYGLRGTYEGDALGLAGLPFLRLPVPPNPNPQTVSYAALREVLAQFDTALAGAEAALDAVGDRPVALRIDLARVRLDLTGDGGKHRAALLPVLFEAVAGPFQVRPGVKAPLAADFDAADAAWLQGYANLLMAMSDFVLAHDWEAAYSATFHNLFPASFIEADSIAARAGTQTMDPRTALQYGGIADMIAFVHLIRWPVVEPDRAASALGHLESTIALSRESWRRILSEIDDADEWIPAPGQSGVLAGLAIDQPILDGWLAFLDEAEALLAGEKLLPHWRFEEGVNLRRMFLEPNTLDAVLIGQGSAVLPYLEPGPQSDAATWARLMRVFGGDFFRYFVWIN